MKFVLTYSIKAETWEKAVERFLETGAPPPPGVTLVDRLHAVAGRHGFLIVESNEETALYRFAAEWSDVCDLSVIPVVDDKQASEVLESLR